jgi:hypothetical protein
LRIKFSEAINQAAFHCRREPANRAAATDSFDAEKEKLAAKEKPAQKKSRPKKKLAPKEKPAAPAPHPFCCDNGDPKLLSLSR